MEVLAGARDDAHRERLWRFTRRFELLPVAGLLDHEEAAEHYRACRRAGETVRSLIDCLIAAVAIRNQVPVAHHDADFEALARHTPLQVVPVQAGGTAAGPVPDLRGSCRSRPRRER